MQELRRKEIVPETPKKTLQKRGNCCPQEGLRLVSSGAQEGQGVRKMIPERRDEGDAKTPREPKRLATGFPLRARPPSPPFPQGPRSFEGTQDTQSQPSPEASSQEKNLKSLPHQKENWRSVNNVQEPPAGKRSSSSSSRPQSSRHTSRLCIQFIKSRPLEKQYSQCFGPFLQELLLLCNSLNISKCISRSV